MRIAPAEPVEATALYAAFTAAFSDYIAGPFTLAPGDWPQLLARQGVDLALSRVALRGDEVLAFALVAPRPESKRWRLSTMGAVPAARGQGAAPALLDDLIARGRAADLVALELEVIAQNERALRLYRGRGFEARHELAGYVLEVPAAAPPVAAAPAVEQVELQTAFAWLRETAEAIADLPLQVMPAILQALVPPPLAWRRGQAQLIFGGAEGRAIVIHSLVDRDPAQGDARALIEALRALHPARAVRVPPLQRADVGGTALRQAGFEPLALSQLWMLKPL